MSQPAASGATAAPARRHNLGRLLTLVHREGPQSRSALTRRTGLNRSTIGGLVGELVAPAWSTETDPIASTGVGRPSPLVDGRPVGGGADGQPRHRRRDASVWSVWAASVHKRIRYPVVGWLDGDRGGQPGRGAGGRDAFGAGQPVPGAGRRRGRAGSGRAVDRDGDPGSAPALARRAARRPDHGGHRLPLCGGQRRPDRAGGRGVVRGRSGPAATSSTSTAAPAGSAAASSAAGDRCSVGTGTPASSATASSTRTGGAATAVVRDVWRPR